MKTLLITIAALTFSLTSFGHNDKKAKRTASNQDKTFRISSDFMNGTDKMKNATLRITQNGVTYEEYSTESGKIRFTLPKNSQFMLEFSSDGYFTKRIAINTEVSDNTEDVPQLMLTMELVKENAPKLMEKDLDLLDFPLVYMAFDSDEEYFYDKNKYYSEIIVESLNESAKKFYKKNRFSYNQ